MHATIKKLTFSPSILGNEAHVIKTSKIHENSTTENLWGSVM
jgi:hypothetical protein